jgi:hypothetical protein
MIRVHLLQQYNSIFSHYNQDLNTTLAEMQHSIGSWEVGTQLEELITKILHIVFNTFWTA